MEEGRSLILRHLHRRIGQVPTALQAQIQALPLIQLEALGEAILDFSSELDLRNWLQTHPSK